MIEFPLESPHSDVRALDRMVVMGLEPHLIQSREEFAAELTALRDASGLSMRRLSNQVDAPLATLGGYFSGRHLPTVSQTDLFRRVLGCLDVTGPTAVADWLDALNRVRRTAGSARGTGIAPYRGLECFQPEHAGWFFGREALTDLLVEEAKKGGFFALVGASGSGKSSLLRAGLVPALLASAGSAWVCRVMAPGLDPFGELEKAFGAERGERPPGLAAVDVAVEVSGPLLLVVDQFEELFTVDRTSFGTREQFLTLLRLIVDGRRDGATTAVAIGLRADFYTAASRDPDLLQILQHRQLLVGAMNGAELRRAIEEPARRVGLVVDEDLVDLLIHELAPRGLARSAHDDGALPLLSHALHQTWLRARRGRLTLADYRAAGDIRGSVEKTAEEAFNSLGPAEQQYARRMFLRLVNVDADSTITRRRGPREQIAFADAEPECAAMTAGVLDRFVEARLVTVDESSAQISHEALLTAWSRLADWIDVDRASLQTHRRLRGWASYWVDSGRDESELMRGARLAAVQEWVRLSEGSTDLDSLEADYLRVSSEAQGRERSARRTRNRRLRQLVAVSVVLAVVAVGAAVFGLQSRAEAMADRATATIERDRALSRQLASEAGGLRSTDPALAAQLALQAFHTFPTVEARSALLDASSGSVPTRLVGPTGPTLVVPNPGGTVIAISNSRDGSITLYSLGQPGQPARLGTMPATADEQQFAGAFSPDGRRFVSGGSAGSVVLWDVSVPAAPVMIGPPLVVGDGQAGVRAVGFARGGQQVLAEGRGPSVLRWDIGSAGLPTALPPLPAPGEVLALAVDEQTNTLAVGGAGGVELWDLAGSAAAPLGTIAPAGGRALSVAFSPDGRTVATGSAQRQLELWNITDPAAPTLESAGPGPLAAQVNAINFSPDGLLIGAATSDLLVQVWDTRTWKVIASYPHTGPATGVTFTPNQQSVVTSSTDGVARIWPFPGPVLRGIGGPVFNLGFSAANELVVGASENPGLLRRWNAADRLHPVRVEPDITGSATIGSVNSATAISPDGRLVVGGSGTGAVGIWEVDTIPATFLSALPGLADGVSSLTFSADGKLVAGSGGRVVQLWDVSDPRQPRTLGRLTGMRNQVYYAAISPDAAEAVAVDISGHTTLWDISDRQTPVLQADLTGVGDSAFSVTFSPDGNYIAVGGIDKTVLLWNIEKPTAPVRVGAMLTGPRAEVYWLSYRADGKQLAAASTDGKVWIWDTTDPAAAVVTEVLTTPTGGVYSAVFSPDGTELAAAGSAAEVRVWATHPDVVAAAICADQGQGITESEWRLYLPDQPYQPPCPIVTPPA